MFSGFATPIHGDGEECQKKCPAGMCVLWDEECRKYSTNITYPKSGILANEARLFLY